MSFTELCRIAGRTGVFEATYKAGVLDSLIPIYSKDALKTPFWLSPGLFDIQVNGMIGHSFSAEDLTVEKVASINEELEKHGITRWCATVTTQAQDLIERNLKIIAESISSGAAPSVHCIHLEGHYVSAEKGYRGVHIPRYIRDPDPKEFDRWQQAARGRIGLFSLAPDRKGSLKFIRKLRGEGVRVGLVHHNASHEDILAAVSTGADLSSHLVNGCAPLIHRQHNIIWSQLSIDELWASFIADGYHIPYYTLRAVIKSKGIRHSILVSDLAHLSGLPDGEYVKNEKEVILQDGGLWVKNEGKDLLSGAVKTLEKGCEFVASMAGFAIEDSFEMASTNPARYFQVESDFTLFPGRKGPVVVFSWDNEKLKVERVLK
jgi:N-acetylglucosamine-6-phosphate deacetylase